MKNNMNIELMKQVKAKIIAVNKKLDELYEKHKTASMVNRKAA